MPFPDKHIYTKPLPEYKVMKTTFVVVMENHLQLAEDHFKLTRKHPILAASLFRQECIFQI